MYGDHRDLHVLTHSFPTRRSSDLFRTGDDDLSEIDRRRTRYRARAGDDRFVEMERDRGRAQMRARQADRQFDQHEGRRRAVPGPGAQMHGLRSEEHTTELQSLMRISSAVFCLKKKKYYNIKQQPVHHNEYVTYKLKI